MTPSINETVTDSNGTIVPWAFVSNVTKEFYISTVALDFPDIEHDLVITAYNDDGYEAVETVTITTSNFAPTVIGTTTDFHILASEANFMYDTTGLFDDADNSLSYSTNNTQISAMD